MWSAFPGALIGVLIYINNNPGASEQLPASRWLVDAAIHAVISALLLFMICAGIRKGMHTQEKEECERERRAAEKKRLDEEEARARSREARDAELLNERLARIPDAMRDEYSRAARCLERGAESLHGARQAFDASAFVPFWESVEMGAECLSEHRRALDNLDKLNGEFRELARNKKARVVPDLDEGLFELPRLGVGESLSESFRDLVRTAHSNFQFATIYEQRRTTRTIAEGFGSLNNAVERLAGVIRSSCSSLETSLRSAIDASSSVSRERSGLMDAHISVLASPDSFGGHISEINSSLRQLAKRA